MASARAEKRPPRLEHGFGLALPLATRERTPMRRSGGERGHRRHGGKRVARQQRDPRGQAAHGRSAAPVSRRLGRAGTRQGGALAHDLGSPPFVDGHGEGCAPDRSERAAHSQADRGGPRDQRAHGEDVRPEDAREDRFRVAAGGTSKPAPGGAGRADAAWGGWATSGAGTARRERPWSSVESRATTALARGLQCGAIAYPWLWMHER